MFPVLTDFQSPLEQPWTTANGTVPPFPTSTPSSFVGSMWISSCRYLTIRKGAASPGRTLGTPEKAGRNP